MLKKGPYDTRSNIYKFINNIKNISYIKNTDKLNSNDFINNIDFRSIPFINNLYILINCIEKNNFEDLTDIYIKSFLDYLYNLINNPLDKSNNFYFMILIKENNITNIKEYIINRIYSFIDFFEISVYKYTNDYDEFTFFIYGQINLETNLL